VSFLKTAYKIQDLALIQHDGFQEHTENTSNNLIF
jgi:hypothetical protein